MIYNDTSINNYKYFVFNTFTNAIFSGWEFKEDAEDSLKEAKELYVKGWKIYTKSYIQNYLHINVKNSDNWLNVNEHIIIYALSNGFTNKMIDLKGAK